MTKQDVIAKGNALLKSIDLSRPGAASAGNLRVMIDGKVAEQRNKGLDLPSGYSSSNALTAALLRLDDVKNRNNVPAMQCCTPASILQALMDMVVQGLSPNKDQCYFIVYGNTLTMQRSYFGTVSALKRLSEIDDVMAQVVHEGEEFEIGSDDNFQTIVTKFTPKADCLDKPIKFAFALIITTDGKKHFTIMSQNEIKTSWSQARTHAVQQKFAQEMARRTVLNRAAKMYVNTSDDSDLISGAINDAVATEQGNADDRRRDVTPQKDEDQTQTIIDTIGKDKSTKPEKPKPKEEPKKAPRKKKAAKPQTPKKPVGGDNHVDSNENEEYPVVEGQTDLFENETTTTGAQEADAQ